VVVFVDVWHVHERLCMHWVHARMAMAMTTGFAIGATVAAAYRHGHHDMPSCRRVDPRVSSACNAVLLMYAWHLAALDTRSLLCCMRPVIMCGASSNAMTAPSADGEVRLEHDAAKVKVDLCRLVGGRTTPEHTLSSTSGKACSRAPM
jgi:hypothetical protein